MSLKTTSVSVNRIAARHLKAKQEDIAILDRLASAFADAIFDYHSLLSSNKKDLYKKAENAYIEAYAKYMNFLNSFDLHEVEKFYKLVRIKRQSIQEETDPKLKAKILQRLLTLVTDSDESENCTTAISYSE